MMSIRSPRRFASQLSGFVSRLGGGSATALGNVLAACLPQATLQVLLSRLSDQEPQALLEVLGPRLNRKPTLDTMPFDLPVPGRALQFEHLAGLFASTSLDHAVIAMTIRQTAYLFGVIRQMQARKVIEVGRYKGGSTLVIAAAMSGEGQLWSIDIGEKEARLYQGGSARPFDQQLADVCRRLGLRVDLIVGDSRTVQVETGEVDLVLIDGDHSYEGAKNDFERFGRRVRVGGAVLLDDTFDEEFFKTHSDTVGRLVQEIVAEGEFQLVKAVNRLAHLERVRPA